jgi:predicted RNase H-like HicB family nuclease
VKYRV